MSSLAARKVRVSPPSKGFPQSSCTAFKTMQRDRCAPLLPCSSVIVNKCTEQYAVDP